MQPAWATPSHTGSQLATARRWLAEGQGAVLVEVIETKGSVPRETGTRMLVARHDTLGTIGGGHLEFIAIDEARTRLAQGAAGQEPMERAYPLGPALGQCCGGAVTLRYTPLTAAHLDAWPEATVRLQVQLYGAGHVGRAIAAALAPLPFAVAWIDEREEAFPHDPAWFTAHPQIQRVCVEPVEAEVRTAAAGTAYLVLTHSHDLDQRIVEAILRRSDFAYCGLIGSRSKRERFHHRLTARGLSEAAWSRLTCPIGVPGIEGKEPEVIAAAVAAQLLQIAPPRA